MTSRKAELPVVVFTDYVCPFCYVADRCLERLHASYHVLVNWCFLELNPEAPVAGQPVSELGYSKDKWREMMSNLGLLAESAGVDVEEETFTTNSHKALLLAEAAKAEGREVFYTLHKEIFEAFINKKQNIADPDLLRKLAAKAGVSVATVERAWTDPRFEQRLKENHSYALKFGVSGIPTFIIGGQVLTGAPTTEMLFDAARRARDQLRDFI